MFQWKIVTYIRNPNKPSMKPIFFFFLLGFSISCSQKLNVTKNSISIVDLINYQHKKRVGIKETSYFNNYDKRIYEVRTKAVKLFSIEVDTSKINQFIVWNLISFGGGNIDGKIIINDSLFYNYTASYRLGERVDILKYQILPGNTENIIEKYLKERKYKELEALAKEKGNLMSGSNFIYIGMYQKGVDSIYVNILPAFIIN